jgi:hypothetical protein
MIKLSKAQSITLSKMPCYYIVTQLSTGALVVVFELACQTWMVVDTEGQIFGFSRYISTLERSPQDTPSRLPS